MGGGDSGRCAGAAGVDGDGEEGGRLMEELCRGVGRGVRRLTEHDGEVDGEECEVDEVETTVPC